jgi:hypothetical protein
MTTSPHEAAFQGTQDFLTQMKALVEQKDKLLQPTDRAAGWRTLMTNSLGPLMTPKTMTEPTSR